MAVRTERRTPLTDILLERIEREGPLTFAAYMQTCLYHPEHGYYTSYLPRTGRRDYYTSVEVGPLFARLLARQAREMWDALDRPAGFDLVECGAGSGRLARELLGAVREQWPPFAQALRVTLVEASPPLRAKAEEAAGLFGGVVRIVPAMPAAPITGCILSNELVDALPVHRVVRREDSLREIWIAAKEGELCEQESEVSSARVAAYLEHYGAPLAVGQIAEVQLAALDWLERAAACLERGFILTIDYGHRARELYGPGHARGTLMAYRHHRAHEDWLAWPGAQDLTAHVNFTALEQRGRELGLTNLGFTTQTNFLLALARAGGFADLDPGVADEAEQQRARQELKQLIHPEGMGETFKVLVQGSGVEGARLSGLAGL